MEKLPAFSVKRLFNATGYSLAGLVASFKTEAAFRLEVIVSAVLIPVVLLGEFSAIEMVLLIGSLLLVLMMELANTAVEAVVDRISTEKHELSGKAKDAGSAAVFVALVNAGFVWAIICFF